MFTFGDICNIAVQIEKNGEETYRKASAIVEDTQLQELLLWMADQEKQHANWFSSLKSDRPLTPEQLEMENVGKTLLQDMMKGNTFLLDPEKLKNSSNLKEVLNQAATFEQDTIVFYEFLQGFLEDDETVKQLRKIVEEERGHMQQLESAGTLHRAVAGECGRKD